MVRESLHESFSRSAAGLFGEIQSMTLDLLRNGKQPSEQDGSCMSLILFYHAAVQCWRGREAITKPNQLIE